MRKRPGSVYDKWNISVVICDTDVLCFILYTQENTFLIIFNLYIYMTTFFISVVDNHEARLCVDLLCSFDKSVECPTIT